MAGGREYDATKLGELVLYVADRSLSDPRFGKTKLNKILFFADFTAYQELGRSITGAEYQHLPQGPAPQQLLPVLGHLRAWNAITVRGEATFAGTQHRVVPLRDPDLSAFTANEIAIVDRWVSFLAPMSNVETSDLSHRTVAWRLTYDYQEIPYGTALFAAEPPSEDDLAWLREVAATHGTVEGT